MMPLNSVTKSFLISFAAFFTLCSVYYLVSVSQTGGRYFYLIDDAYIHLAMAKNIAFHQTWGVTKYAFSSTSSSPAFTYMISMVMKLCGNDERISLWINSIFSTGIVYILSLYFRNCFIQVKNMVLSVLFTLFFSVLHLQLLSGMEHVLHVFLFVLNIFCLTHLHHRSAALIFYASLSLMGLVRFESMFYFAILAAVFAVLSRWKEAGFILAAGFIPVAAFCCFNYSNSGYLFPNSVVVKGTVPAFDADFFRQAKLIVLDNFLLNISFYKIGFFPVLICLVFIIRDFRKKTIHDTVRDNLLLVVVSLLMICHSLFADLKGLFRYEAYLLAGFSMAVIPRLKNVSGNPVLYTRREHLVSFALLMNVVLMCYKCFVAHPLLCGGGKSIMEQQVQSAKFLHACYNESKIVANDIGAITYYTDIHLLDIAGLASVETIAFNRNRREADDAFEDFLLRYTASRNYEIAVVYDAWLRGHIPRNWKKAAVLKIQNPVTVARDEVSVYAIGATDFRKLKENIRTFRWDKNVRVTMIE